MRFMVKNLVNYVELNICWGLNFCLVEGFHVEIVFILLKN